MDKIDIKGKMTEKKLIANLNGIAAGWGMNVFNLSFGKDSMATLLLAIEQGIPIDHVMYCDIRFSDEISGEHPLMAAWIPEAERILKERFVITGVKRVG